ncbi:MAG TPA: CRTAC1 family protein [Blastocatellia bacterium]|nr:CRTAC1 family protein [Blastocatellia bacterium]HMV82052.1 CRTAC1 family protein [Blastocatellia bacterium]HMX24054.1 CRTAC1 family protein [Blastocatellia bacterium]HMZ16919.1 CRTAC1 family protein [Blastocatellia bacterium]HNG29380.1 CRTAC1 family protein [Blastocatellia bacterium]
MTRQILIAATLFFSCVSAGGAQAPLFREVAEETGLKFQHFTGATGEYFMPEIMGAGCALLDYDNDGDLDVYLVQGTLLDEKKKLSEASFPPPAGWESGNRLFRNELIPSGKLRFTDVTRAAGVGHVGYGMGVAVGDIDNDGDLDLYLTNAGSNALYRNNGNGTFTDATREAGVDDPRWSTSAAFLDYDRDGDLDLYVCNYVDFTVKSHKRCFAPTGEPDYCAPRAYRPLPDRLFRNDGKGRFTDVSQASGIGNVPGPGLGVTCADFNGDGWPDIYVANDGAANFLWLNKHDGTFEESGLLAGAAYGMDGVARAGMGAAAGDFDNDGDEDLLITNLTREGSTLYRNNGRGQFQDSTQEFNLTQPTFLSTGFGAVWLDYDNDGRLDLFTANGAVTIIAALKGKPYPFHQRNQLFHNEASAAFREVTATAGPALQLSEVSRGVATGDVDNDGDVDLLVSNNNGPARLLLNETGARRNWLTVKLEGVKDNRHGIGARVAVFRKGEKPLWRRVHSDGSYLSAGDARAHFGLGAATEIESVVVQWPGGDKEVWNNLKPNKQVTLRRQTGKPWKASPESKP